MAKGIAITITRMEEVREPRKDDARYHKIWNGRMWVSLCTMVWSPSLAKSCGVMPEAITTRLEFLPPGTYSIEAIRYRRLIPEMRKAGLLQ
jgi:hypothetical protein